MELSIHSSVVEGLKAWLSGALQIPFGTASIEQLNPQISASGFTLYEDTENTFTLRVSYSGYLVQQQDEHYILTLNLMTRISRFGGRSQMVVMRCPVVSVPNTEYIQCDPEYVQVTRQVPYDNWNNELPWSLSLGDQILVALEDASLIQMNVDMDRANISVQGRKREVLSPVMVLNHESEFLALKLISGQHAYSLEATCPTVTDPTAEQTVLHIYKCHMGLTRRGHVPETLTVRHVTLRQTENFTFHENGPFVTIVIPTAQILHLQSCPDNKQIWQPVYRADVVLRFRETNHTVQWSVENVLPCSDLPKLNFTRNLSNEPSREWQR
ncbi:uncharacterized protein C1orf127 homolog [Eucyclogobius newberryi]|uniref:uncharacterized protein C1orf127 homolog n=1 Tax=Eucyclogobius newberryi TaxID=166745 RepID=UPI003B598610